MKTTQCLALLLVLSLASGVAWAGQETTVEGVPHVKNGATPSDGKQTLNLKELWRAGGEDGETLFGLVSQVLTDDEGNIYLLDSQLSEVQVLSPDGEPLRTLSREGEGPGEVRTPTDMAFLPDSTLGLAQAFPGRLVKVDLEGNPAGSLTFGSNDPTSGGFSILLDVQSRGDNLVMCGLVMKQIEGEQAQNQVRFLASYTGEGEEKTRYLESTTRFDFQNIEIIESEQYFVFPRRWTIGADGKIYAPPHRDEYVINVYSADGTLERVIEREFERLPRTEKEKARIEAAMEAQTQRIPAEVKTETDEYEPVIVRTRVTADGALWVHHNRSYRDQPEGIMLTYDVFDPTGHLVKQVSVACEGNGEDDGLFFAGTNRIILVKGLTDAAMALQAPGSSLAGDEEPEPMEIVCFEIES